MPTSCASSSTAPGWPTPRRSSAAPSPRLASCADVLSFGGTKNGAMGVEAVVVMHQADGANAKYLRKQHMQLSSKMRFLAAQFNALLADDLWLRNAAHANAMAARLAAGLADIPGVEVVYPVQADAVFARLDPRPRRLAAAGLDLLCLG